MSKMLLKKSKRIFVHVFGLLSMAACSCILLLSSCATPKPDPQTMPYEGLLAETPIFEQYRSFQKLVEMDSEAKGYEEAKIEYLFERLGKSRYNFIRNEKVYSHVRAMMHLRWKAIRYRQDAKTAEDFINQVACGSRLTGEPYLLELSGNKRYMLQYIFMNELAALEEALKKTESQKLQTTE